MKPIDQETSMSLVYPRRSTRPQFGLKALLIGISVTCGVLAITSALGVNGTQLLIGLAVIGTVTALPILVFETLRSFKGWP